MPLITQHLDLTVENRCLGSTSPRFHHETGQNLFGILTVSDVLDGGAGLQRCGHVLLITRLFPLQERGNGTMSWADNNTSLEPDELSVGSQRRALNSPSVAVLEVWKTTGPSNWLVSIE
jgi:hypothetical protein